MEEKESVEYAKIMATASAEKLSEYLKVRYFRDRN